MKFRLLRRRCVKCAIALCMSSPFLAMAQGLIQQASEPYISKPEIAFTLAQRTKAISEKNSTASIAAPAPIPAQAAQQINPTPAKPTWEVRLQDVNFANTFTRWAAESGWRVRWDARKHVLVEAPDRLTGSFEDAVTAVLEGPGIAGSAYPLEVCFYPNQPPLARITRKGEQDKECK